MAPLNTVLRNGQQGPVLGTITLAPGERLLLLSDGVVDTADEAQTLFGVERLREVLTANQVPEQLFDDIQMALARFGGHPRDDVSMMDLCMVEKSRVGVLPNVEPLLKSERLIQFPSLRYQCGSRRVPLRQWHRPVTNP